MFKSICSRAIGRVSTQAMTWGRDVFRRSLGVLMFVIAASVMLNLATPAMASADALPPVVTASFSNNTIQEGETTTLTMVLVNDAGFPLYYQFFYTAASFGNFLPPGVVLGPNAVAVNDCGFAITAIPHGGSPTAGASAFTITKLNPGITSGATCTVSFEITAAIAGSYSFSDYELYVIMEDTTDFYVPIASPGTLTVTAAPLPDPTPTLTFNQEVTTALVATDFSLAATSSVDGPGAGAITYSSSDSNIVWVDPGTGYGAALAVGEVTITAFQAAAAGVNAEATATMTFTVEPRTPTITSLSVTSGPQTGGTTVVLTGTNLDTIGDVYFGANAVGFVQINSATEIVVTSPAGAEGAVDVTVTSLYGTSVPNAGSVFTYDPLPPPPPAPTITGLSPSSGSTDGGTIVEITGTGFSVGFGHLSFGSPNYTPYVIISDTLIRAETLTSAAGVVDVTLTTENGTSATGPDAQFTYVAPADPTPTLTFDTPTSASVVYGDGLTNAATSDITGPGAGAIIYSSSDEAVATVDASTGAITPVRVGTATITATQSAASGVNTEVSAVYALAVTPAPLTVTESLSASLVNPGDGLDLNVTITNTTGGDIVPDDVALIQSFVPGGVATLALGAPASNSCGGYLSSDNSVTKVIAQLELAKDASCATTFRLVATGAPGLTDEIIVAFRPKSGVAMTQHSLTLTIATPTPTLTFDTPTSASVVYGDGLTNAATSDITGPGAGAITYSSSDEAVATVDATTGAITTASAGAATITATQAAADGVNAEGVATYALTVTSGTGSTSGATLGASTVAVGDTVDLTITVSNFSGVDVVAGDGAAVSASLNFGLVNYGSGPLSNDCGGSQTGNNIYLKAQLGLAVANGATCTIVYRLTATGASASPESIAVLLTKGGSHLNDAGYTLPLTVTPPVPVLTFETPTAASVNLGSVLNNAATSTITGGGAGEITYASSDISIATVAATTGTITPVSVGTAIITATQAGNATINAAGIQTYVLTVAALTPTVTALSPNNGVTSGGTSVQLTGTNFIDVSAVTFGGTNALFFIPVSATRVTAFAPPGVGAVNVTVTTPGGTSAADAANLFTYIPVPVLTFDTPTAASVAMGGSLTNPATSNVSGVGAGAITYDSNNAGVATVDVNTGAITPVEPGIVIITATQAAGDGVNGVGTQSYQLTVTPPTPVLTFSTPTTASVDLGDSLTNAATSNISGDGAGAITYASTDTGVATVDPQTGEITPVAAGTTTITATQASSGIVNLVGTQTYLLTVTVPTPVLGVTMTHTGSAYKGSTFDYVITPSATVASTSGTLTLTWSLPSDLTFVGATGAGWSCPSSGCTSTTAISAGANGNPITLTVSVGANATSPQTPSVTLSGGGALSDATASDSGTTILSPAAPTITVTTTSFPSTIAVGGTTQLTFTLTNPNPARVTGVAVSLSLPFGLVINQNSGGQFVNNCTNGSLSGSTSGASVTLSGAQINASTSCTFTVVVRGAAAGSPSVPTGTPSATGASAGAAGTPLALTVNPVLTTTQAIASVTLTQDVAVTPFTPVTAAGGAPALRYDLSGGGGLPAGLNFSTTTGQITGTPLSPRSTTTYTVTVIDASVPTALFSSKTFDLTVVAPPDPTPVLSFANPATTFFIGGSNSGNGATSTVTGPDAGAITYASSNPAVASVDAVTGAPLALSAGTATITATQAAAPGVNAQATASYDLVVKGSPTVTSFTPTTVSTEGGDTVVLLGAYFTNVTELYLVDQAGGYHPLSFNLVSDGELNFVTPAVPAGNTSIRLTFGGGTVIAGNLTSQVPIPAPVVTAVSPSSGPEAGGALVTITGSGFEADSSVVVMFSGAWSPNVSVLSDTTIQATTPGGTGVVDVTVTHVGGTSAITPAGLYSYIPAPTLTELDKSFGSTLGGSVIQIQGAGFTAGSTVTFGGVDAVVTFIDANRLSVVSPAHGIGPVDVVVTESGQASNAASYFFGPPPTVSIMDSAGTLSATVSTSAPVMVMLYTFYQEPVAVTVRTVDGTAEAGRDYVSRQATITFQPGETAKSFDVEILPSSDFYPARYLTLEIVALTGAAISDGSAILRIDNNNPSPAPTVTGLVPSSGLTSGGTVVTVTGTNFTGVTAVMFGPVAAPDVRVISPTEIQAVSPAGVEGVVDVTVITPEGTSAVSETDQFTYLPVPDPTPTLTFASPDSASVVLGLTLTNVATSSIDGAGAGAITYSSDDTDIATVDETTGVVTPVSVGETTIVATQAAAAGINSGTSASYALTVTAPPAPPAIAGRVLPGWTVNNLEYSQTIVATGGLAPLTFVVDSGALPHGLALNGTTGEIAGIPTEAGDFGFNVRVTDSLGRSATDRFAMTVNPAITVAPTTVGNGVVGQPFSLTFVASGGTGHLTLYRKGEIPDGLVLDLATGVLSGVPTATGTFEFLVYAEDETEVADGNEYTMVIEPGGPSAGPVTLAVAYGSTDNLVTLALDGPAADSVAVGTQPAHGVATVDGLALRYTPAAGYYGADSFTYSASNANGTSAPATVTVTVERPAAPVANAARGEADFGGTIEIDLADSVEGVFTGVSVSTPLSGRGALTLSGTIARYRPADGSFGEETFSFVATGPGGTSAPATVTLVVLAPVIVITPDSLPSATRDEAYSVVLTASGAAEPYRFAIGAGALPAGLALSPDGRISGTPTVSGSFAFTVQVTGSVRGGHLPPVERSFNLTVDAPPAPVAEALAVSVSVVSETDGGETPIDLSTSVANATGIVIVTPPQHGVVTVNGFVVTYTPDAGYFGPDSFTYRAVGLPGSGSQASVALSGTGDKGAASEPGVSALATVSITVLSPTLTLTPASLSPATVGAAFSQSFTAAGGTAPYSDYRVSAGVLPAGLTLSPTGLLSGTPTQGGTFDFTVAATDSSTGSGPFTASGAYSLTVEAPTLSLSPGSLSDGLLDTPYDPVSFTASGGTAPYSFSLSAGSLPTGLTLSSAGLLSGTPTQSGVFNLTVLATDSSTGSGPFTSSRTLTLTIGVPAPPVASSASLASPYNSTGVDLDVAPLVAGVYSNVALADGPSHGSVAVSGARFTYTPTAGYYGPDSFSYTAAGPGGTSAPATVTVTVAAPAPVSSAKSATTTANAPVDIAVTSGDSGPIASIAVTQPGHGLATVNGLSVTYTPATDYFGSDSFSYTATGAGGTSAPAVVSVTVSPLPVPTAPARTASVLAGSSLVLEAAADATGGPFTAVALVSPPADGTATVSGQQITYAAPAGFSGTTSFSYSLSNPFGTSAPISVTLTVNPLPTTAAPITVIVPADGSGSAVLTTGATGGPFTAAAIVSLSPAGSGTVAIHQGSGPSGPTFTLTFTAAPHVSGTATVRYTLTNAFATSAPGTVIFQVQPRPDPTLDPDVKGLIAAQTDLTLRFATAQLSNFNQRLESLRNGPGQSDLTGASLNFGDLFHRGDQSDPFALRDRQLGRQDADVAPWGVRPVTPAEAAGFRAAGDGGAGDGGGDTGVSLWTGGTIDLGLRRSKAGLSKLDFTTQGVSLGADVSLGDTVVVGAGAGYSSDRTDIGSAGSRSKATSTVGVIYGAWHASEKTYLELVLGYGEMSFDSRRMVALTGLPAFGERDGSQLFASVTAAFEQRDGALTWTPYGRLAMVSAQLDAFTEVSAGLGALTFHAQDVRSLKGVAGLTADYAARTRYGMLTPALRLEYAYEFEDAGTYSLSYADWVGGPVYSGRTDALGRGRLTLGLGAHLERGPLLLGLEYRSAVGSDEATSNQVSATARIRF